MSETSGSKTLRLRGAVKAAPVEDLEALFDAEASVGSEIKHLRKACGLTLDDVSAATGLSKGHLSQVERGVSSPSIKALHAISRALGVTISWFFPPAESQDEDVKDYVVRGHARRQLRFESGITDELLSPNLGRGLELLRCTFAPHSASGPEAYDHQGEEAGLVLSGQLTLWLEEKKIILKAGDSFAFESSLPHRYANEGAEEAVLIWVITPPTY